ncbi:hypothetical protein ACO0QE_002698 [Hanseniaspora vineae]
MLRAQIAHKACFAKLNFSRCSSHSHPLLTHSYRIRQYSTEKPTTLDSSPENTIESNNTDSTTPTPQQNASELADTPSSISPNNVYSDNYFASITNVVRSNMSDASVKSSPFSSASTLNGTHISSLSIELRNKEEEKKDSEMLEKAMSIVSNTPNDDFAPLTTESNINAVTPPEELDLNAATRGMKKKPAKENIMVINPSQGFGKNRNKRKTYGYLNQKQENLLKTDEYAFIRNNVLNENTAENTASELNDFLSTNSSINPNNIINSFAMNNLNMTMKSIEQMSKKADGKSTQDKETLLASINSFKPTATTSISPEYHEYLTKTLKKRFTKQQLYDYATTNELPNETLLSKTLAKSSTKNKIVKFILHKIWSLEINYQKVFEHEELLHLDRIQSYLLFFGDENHEIYRYLYERGIKISVELPTVSSKDNEENLRSLVRVQGSQEMCKLAEVYIRERLKKFKTYSFDMKEMITNHFGNVEEVAKKISLKQVAKYIQSEVGCFIQPLVPDVYTECYLHTSSGKDKFTKARRLLLSILNYNPQVHEATIDLTGTSTENTKINKYPNPNIEPLLWFEKNKVFFRKTLPVKRHVSKDSKTTYQLTSNQIDEIYKKLEKLESTEEKLTISQKGLKSNISIQLGSYLEANDKTKTFITQVPHLNEKVLTLPLLTEESENAANQHEEQANTTQEQPELELKEPSSALSNSINETDDQSVTKVNFLEDIEKLKIENEKQGVLLENDYEIADTSLNSMVVLKFNPKISKYNNYTPNEETQFFKPPPMELWFEKNSNEAKPDVYTARCLLPYNETHVFLKTPQLKFDVKIVKDKYIELCSPFYEEHEGEEDTPDISLETIDQNTWLSDQQGLKNYLKMLSKMKAFNVHNVPRLLTLNVPLENGTVLENVEYDVVSIKETTFLNFKYMNKYVTQFSDLKSPELNSFTTQIDFIGGEQMEKKTFGQFLNDVLKF